MRNKKQSMRQKGVAICAIIVVIAILASIFLPAFIQVASAKTTAELEKEVKQAKTNKNNAKAQLDSVKNKKANVAEEVLAIDEEINRVEDEIESTAAAIEQSRANLIIKEEELRVAEENCIEYDQSFKTRARIMYENGTSSYLEVLLGASSFGDFLSRIEMIREIVEYDKKVLAEMKASRDAIRVAKEALEAEKANLEAKEVELANMKIELGYRLEAKQELLAQLHEDEVAYAKAYEIAEADEKKIQKQLQEQAAKEAKAGTQTKYTGTGKFVWPVPASHRVTSKYGYRIHPVYNTRKFHAGIDIGASYGSDIVAAESGTVTVATYGSGYGKYLVINHGSGITTLYAHCSSLLVKVGDKVSRGQVIAKVGSTGVSTGNHLHFEVRINGATTDPLTYVN
ncbi:MAG: peptidoglycan DD-metalloendopeptidase family protein [Clostridia bacterium]|nr:peptidoglycan DD-metalloendopeptidase family protein [Clostridia bacterium]